MSPLECVVCVSELQSVGSVRRDYAQRLIAILPLQFFRVWHLSTDRLARYLPIPLSVECPKCIFFRPPKPRLGFRAQNETFK